MALSKKLAAAALLMLAFQATAACNSVLGIEPAQLDENPDTKPTCPWPAAEPKVDCQTCDEGCASDCTAEVQDCLSDGDCRDSLKKYRKCVGKACRDGSGQCDTCIAASPKTKALVQCLGSCGCSIAQAATLCESYCACMSSKCAGKEPGGANGCVDTCLNGKFGANIGPSGSFEMKPPDWKIYCFWKHCEMAADQTAALHCNHALGFSEAVVCPEPEEAPQAALCEYPKGYELAPCNTNADCCGECREDAKVCTKP